MTGGMTRPLTLEVADRRTCGSCLTEFRLLALCEGEWAVEVAEPTYSSSDFERFASFGEASVRFSAVAACGCVEAE